VINKVIDPLAKWSKCPKSRTHSCTSSLSSWI